MHYFEVAPLKMIRPTSGSFTYSSESPVSVGTFVSVSVGKQLLTGVVIAQATKPSYATKPIEAVLDIPFLPNHLVKTSLWMSEYYATHLAHVLSTILPKGITKKRRTTETKAPNPIRRKRTNFVFTKQQQQAIESIRGQASQTTLLHGITGSGKTAIYIQLVKDALDINTSSIVLVPEISLTSQLVDEFRQHFPDVYVAHSRLTESERHQIWLKIASSTTPLVVIGPRSALFLPVQSLGLIVIDECHEPTYKQEQTPRYSALRVSAMLSHFTGCQVVYGSATPSIADYYIAKQTNRPIITLDTPAKADAIKPEITVVDMTTKDNFMRSTLFSEQLLCSIDDALLQKSQVLIYHNRRGSATSTLCEDCGWAALCAQCSVPMTLHADRHTLQCTLCAAKMRIPTSCPQCKSPEILHCGIGTKRLESELRHLYPHATIARFDGDSAKGDTIDQRYRDLYDGSIDIIIGTQVVAKGLDLPKLTVVGIPQADAGLALPDYTTNERVFQLLTQAIGRVGRTSSATSVVVQTYQPQHPAIICGLTQNYTAFYTQQLPLLKRGLFPPYTHLLKLVCVYKTEAVAIRNAKTFMQTLRKKYPSVVLSGPSPTFYEQQHGTYRWQIIAKSQNRATLLEIINDLPPAHWQFELDPLSLL